MPGKKNHKLNCQQVMATTTKPSTPNLWGWLFVGIALLLLDCWPKSSKKGHDSDTLKFEVKSSMFRPWSCSSVADVIVVACSFCSLDMLQHNSCGIYGVFLSVLLCFQSPHRRCKWLQTKDFGNKLAKKYVSLNSRMLTRFYLAY